MSVSVETVNHPLGINLNTPFLIISFTLFLYYFWTKTSKRFKLIEQLPGPKLSYTELLYQAITLQPKGKCLLIFAISAIFFATTKQKWKYIFWILISATFGSKLEFTIKMTSVNYYCRKQTRLWLFLLVLC